MPKGNAGGISSTVRFAFGRCGVAVGGYGAMGIQSRGGGFCVNPCSSQWLKSLNGERCRHCYHTMCMATDPHRGGLGFEVFIRVRVLG